MTIDVGAKGQAEDKQTIVLIGESVEPFTNATVSFRTVSNYIDKDNHRMEMYEKKEGSEERKIMEIDYKRIKAGSKSDSNKKKQK